MILYLAFSIYLFLFLLFISLAGLNTLKIQRQFKFNPKILTLLSPLLLNFILANYVFFALPPFFTTLFPAALCYFCNKKFQNIRIVGITGGLATGKSVLLKQIVKNLKNTHIIDGNKILSDLLRKDCKGYNKIMSQFGKQKEHFINPLNQEISLPKFLCFLSQNPNSMVKYSKFISEMINFSILLSIIKSLIQKRSFIFVSFPQFHTLKHAKLCCYPIIRIESPEHLRIQRINRKLGYSDEVAIKILKSQQNFITNSYRLMSINNSQSQQELLGNFLAVINPLMKKKQSPSKNP